MSLARAFQRAVQLRPTTLAGASTARSIFIPSSSRLQELQPTLGQSERPWDSIDHTTNKIVERLGKMQKKATNEDIWRSASKNVMEALESYPPHDPYHGRSVRVVDGDVATAFQRLASTLSRNKVTQQLRMSERHEKKGVKRRRLQSERWRRLFAHEVRKNVQLVTKIRNRGA
ncbi:hypothetical protein PM082_013036 [Marasmius tenuissimus]|nr:hypothetical protein PM082_013036 [Marasmius tenuissimus]